MARFETPCQILSLFLCAALVSIAVIAVLRAEARSRYSSEVDKEVGYQVNQVSEEINNENAGIQRLSLLDRLAAFKLKIRNLIHFNSAPQDEQRGPTHDRKRRSLPTADIIKSSEGKSAGALTSENMFSEAISGRKIRNVGQKIRSLKETDQIVKTILEEFCYPRMVANEMELKHQLSHQYMVMLQETKQTAEFICREKLERSRNLQESNKTVKQVSYESDDSSHPIPPISAHDFSRASKNGRVPKPHTNNVCQSYGEVVVIVTVTTIVNVVVFLIISLGRSLALNRDSRRNNAEGYNHFLDESNSECIEKTRSIVKA